MSSDSRNCLETSSSSNSRLGSGTKSRMTSWSEGALEVTHAKKKLRDRIIESCFLELSRDSIGHCHTEKKWDSGTSIKWPKFSESFEGLHFKTLPRNISDALSWWGSHKTQFRVTRKSDSSCQRKPSDAFCINDSLTFALTRFWKGSKEIDLICRLLTVDEL